MNNTEPAWPQDGRDTLPYVLKSTTPIQESSSPSPSLGVYDLPPNLGKGDVLTFPSGGPGGVGGGGGEEVKYKVKRVRFLYKYSVGTRKLKVTKKILEVTELGRDKVERLLERNVGKEGEE
ncbi:hypothetical protein TrCOL_g2175 [Triparma columacea]|uniref:Uncharacterized protein n=1 Tax=Triparma columacea TaxID=722753 RepID=A0A9W7G238_9STRA|nr:hypothetical protein TrCOL_g2175 [Triparma columacea]